MDKSNEKDSEGWVDREGWEKRFVETRKCYADALREVLEKEKKSDD